MAYAQPDRADSNGRTSPTQATVLGHSSAGVTQLKVMKHHKHVVAHCQHATVRLAITIPNWRRFDVCNERHRTRHHDNNERAPSCATTNQVHCTVLRHCKESQPQRYLSLEYHNLDTTMPERTDAAMQRCSHNTPYYYPQAFRSMILTPGT